MKNINFNEPYISGLEKKFLNEVFKENSFYGLGKYTKLCEKFLQTFFKNKNILLTDSCTSSLDIAALLIKNKNKDEIIIPSYTFSSTASAFAKCHFKIVFAEICQKSLMIDVADVLKKINKRTKAIVAVHYGGHPAKILELRKICKKNKIMLIEDAAQGFGCTINNKQLGTFGDIGCYSFHETKNIHSGLGGALYIRSNSLYKRAIAIRERGTNRHELLSGKVKSYSWVELGGSYYPTELQAAFLFAQLKKSTKNLKLRKNIHSLYEQKLKVLKNEKKLFYNDFEKGFKSNYHAFIIILNNRKDTIGLKEYLFSNNISAFIGYVPLHSSKVGLKLGNKVDDLPKTENISKRVLRLPLHTNLSKNEISRICILIQSYFK